MTRARGTAAASGRALLGPLVGGVVAGGMGFAFVGLVPAAAGLAALCVLFDRRPSF